MSKRNQKRLASIQFEYNKPSIFRNNTNNQKEVVLALGSNPNKDEMASMRESITELKEQNNALSRQLAMITHTLNRSRAGKLKNALTQSNHTTITQRRVKNNNDDL
jgi:hypothetical protein